MVKRRRGHAEEDRRRQEAEVRNQAESLLHQTEKFAENGDKVPGTPRQRRGPLPSSRPALDGTTSRRSRRAPRRSLVTAPGFGAAMERGEQRRRRRRRVGRRATSADDVVDAEIVDDDQ